MHRSFLLISVIVALSGCSLDDNLGGNYYFGEHSIYTSENGGGTGLDIIPYGITAYNYDNHVIIARSAGLRNNTAYWIVDKTVEGKMISYVETDSDFYSYTKFTNVFGPLDSAHFFTLKSAMHIKLAL